MISFEKLICFDYGLSFSGNVLKFFFNAQCLIEYFPSNLTKQELRGVQGA